MRNAELSSVDVIAASHGGYRDTVTVRLIQNSESKYCDSKLHILGF